VNLVKKLFPCPKISDQPPLSAPQVYKLERERERDHLLLQSTPPASTSTPAPPGADDNSGDDEAAGKPLSMEELVRFSGLDSLPATDSLRQLLQNSAKPASASKAASPNAPPPFPEPPAALAPYLSQLLGAAAAADQQNNLAELMKRIGAENNNNASAGSGADVTSEDESSPSSGVLRIPSFKPNGNEATEPRGSGSNSPSLGVSLRDVITKSITQKFQVSAITLRYIIKICKFLNLTWSCLGNLL
jgi:hypothetical protein